MENPAGFVGAMILGTGMAILAAVYPSQKRGRAMGFVSLLHMLASQLTSAWRNDEPASGWRSIFYLTAFIAFITAL
jgi:MFS family permease